MMLAKKLKKIYQGAGEQEKKSDIKEKKNFLNFVIGRHHCACIYIAVSTKNEAKILQNLENKTMCLYFRKC